MVLQWLKCFTVSLEIIFKKATVSYWVIWGITGTCAIIPEKKSNKKVYNEIIKQEKVTVLNFCNSCSCHLGRETVTFPWHTAIFIPRKTAVKNL